ncbi:DUF2080 family transposase-associated protein [Natronomonas sp. EA1]|uniref:DUF2080 family transposase-associated protein n=1 Tax=Natronomonas sp. EA1 TaxID=3421655 RepID=UPI003EB6DDC6
MDKFEIAGEEVIEREVKATGNGAHVYLPKEWLDDTVKVVRVPREQARVCGICNEKSRYLEEWCWIDDSGGSFFEICPTCRDNIENGPYDVCSVCRKDREASKSSGFGPIGPDKPHYRGCDTCRKRVIFGDVSTPRPVWTE